MRNKRVFQLRRIVVAMIVVACLLMATSPMHVYADTCATNPDQQTCSSNYGVSETFFGSGGVDTCPTQGSNAYCAKQSAGELTVGNVKGTDYQAQAGFNTDRLPWISIAVTDPYVDLGVLSTTTTKTGTARFRVSAYLSDGYVVQLYGTPPVNSGHTLTPMTGTGVTPGVEQFGLNLVANTSPTVGADPVQDPDYPSQPFGFGTVATGYDTPNSFKFNSGDIVARSTKSSSYTIYTISYVADISAVTPGGVYVGYNSVIATGTY